MRLTSNKKDVCQHKSCLIFYNISLQKEFTDRVKAGPFTVLPHPTQLLTTLSSIKYRSRLWGVEATTWNCKRKYPAVHRWPLTAGTCWITSVKLYCSVPVSVINFYTFIIGFCFCFFLKGAEVVGSKHSWKTIHCCHCITWDWGRFLMWLSSVYLFLLH